MVDLDEDKLRELMEMLQPGHAEEAMQDVLQQGGRPTKVKFEDPLICDLPSCNNETLQRCARCKCRNFCCKECQVAAWPNHKVECKALKRCLQTSQMAQSMADTHDGSSVVLGVCSTKKHGNHFYIMEKFQFYGKESNRQVPLASTTNLTVEGVSSCLLDAILFPQFDCDCAGRRRPYYVEILEDAFADKDLVTALATLCVRLGIHIKSFKDEAEMNDWCSSWFLVQQGWNDAIKDDLFLRLIEPQRLCPLRPNGMARKELGSVASESKKIAARLDPKDYPTRKQVLKLPFSQSDLYVICKDAVLYVICKYAGAGRIALRQPVQLQKRTGRPYPEDVFLCIYKALIEKVKKRPNLILVGQPSVCVLADVRVYEKTLDKSVCKDPMSLAAKGNLEGIYLSAIQ